MSSPHVPSIGDRVIISGGKKVGSVERLVIDDDGEVTGFVIRYGWRGKKAKVALLTSVKWCNTGSVVLDLSRHHFDDLVDWVPPVTANERQSAPGTSQQAAHP